MARTRGIFNFSANLEVKKNAPLDSRLVVDTLNELTETATWADSDGKVWLYDGIVVTVRNKGGLYMLTNYDPVTAATAYSDLDNWKAVDASAAKINIEDNLTSTSTTAALSANQGKVLKTEIETLKTNLSAALTYKGSVADFASLPTNAQKGDTYNVVAANGNIPAGTNYAWNGTEWDPLGGTVDLSSYYTKTQTDSAIETAVSEVSGDLTVLETTVADHTSKLNIITGTEETSGSLANTLKVSKDYTDTQLTNYVEKVEGSSLIPADKLTLIDTNASDISALEVRVEANEAALTILKADENTAGSILNIVKTNINAALEWQELN